MNTQKLRDGPLSVARQNVADPQPPPSLQFFLETWSPHAYIYACSQNSVREYCIIYLKVNKGPIAIVLQNLAYAVDS